MQLKLGRLGIGWTQEELGERASVSRDTVSALEVDAREVLSNNRTAVVHALEKAGVSFETTAERLTVHVERAAAYPPGPARS